MNDLAILLYCSVQQEISKTSEAQSIRELNLRCVSHTVYSLDCVLMVCVYVTGCGSEDCVLLTVTKEDILEQQWLEGK
jgi:hypothetical protein